MIGKKNIAFGFVFLIFTVSLGPYMVKMYEDWGAAYGQKQTDVGRLQQLKTDEFEEELESLSAEAIAKANTDGILALNTLMNVENEIDLIKGGPHAHGNLESLLNIIVGIVLCFIAASPRIKQTISWLFILGALFHSGFLYLERVFQIQIPAVILGIGPVMLMLGLVLMAIFSIKGFRGELIRDD